MQQDEVTRARIVFTDGTTKEMPFVSMGRKIKRFEADGVFYTVDIRRDFDDIDALE